MSRLIWGCFPKAELETNKPDNTSLSLLNSHRLLSFFKTFHFRRLSSLSLFDCPFCLNRTLSVYGETSLTPIDSSLSLKTVHFRFDSYDTWYNYCSKRVIFRIIFLFSLEFSNFYNRSLAFSTSVVFNFGSNFLTAFFPT